ncbi:MAG: acetate kinase, partial [Desulfobulbaceae bacterium]|nr:acetate kinase [Desulfobulbaceae bacterium]
REKICSDMEYLGIQLDRNLNDSRLEREEDTKLISIAGASVRICVVRTNEEMMIGKETYEAIRNITEN